MMANILRKAGYGGGWRCPIALGLSISTAQADRIRIALAETPSDELAGLLRRARPGEGKRARLRMDRLLGRGELAIQAVLSGQMDIGFGTPYAAMQRSKAPVRIIFQLSKLKFFPVTTMKYGSLEDLDGEPILLHSRGGGTDSIANVIEDKMSIEFGERILRRPGFGEPRPSPWWPARRTRPSSTSRTRTR